MAEVLERGKQNPERIAEADRAAAALGVPGVTVPEPYRTQHAREEAATPRLDVEEFVREEQDEAFRRADVAGDRTASWRDMEKLRAPHREKVRGTDEKK
jgi:sugar phosphate isomerase/epimerase